MSGRPEHEDDGNETEMSGLQPAGKASEDSQQGLQRDAERQQDGDKTFSDSDKDAAYRKLYAIVTIMTMILFGLNIAQVCLLPVISSLYWIVLFPGIVFLAFTLWAWLFIAFNRKDLFGHLGGLRDGRERASQHLQALFWMSGRSQVSRRYGPGGPSWPRRFARAGVFLTIFLNIVLCQFIYLPIFAVPAFREINWKMELNASTNISTPSFALLQNTELSRRATLENNATSIDQMCQEKMSNPVFRSQYCFSNAKNFTYGANDSHHAQYVIFDGSSSPNISMGMNIDLWYQYYFNSTASSDPLLGLVVFDTNLLPKFVQAFRCGILTATSFPAGDRNQISLRQVTINDPYNAMDRRGEGCKDEEAFKHYSIYETEIIPLGTPSAPGPNDCDIGDDAAQPANGSCDVDITVTFSSTLARVYTSEHGKDWVTILTEEGGVVGFVTFLTWFLGIFAL